MTLAEARRVVLKAFPDAFGWREFSVSDYSIESGTGETIARACYAKDAWELAAQRVLAANEARRECWCKVGPCIGRGWPCPSKKLRRVDRETAR